MGSRYLLLGLAFAVGLAWLALEWLREPPNPAAPPAQEAREPTPLNLPSAYVGDIDAFLEVVERPLFIEGRQPTSANVDGADEEGLQTQNQIPAVQQTLGNLRLTAVVDDGGKRSALLESTSGETERVDVGSRVNNWTVDSIRDDAVVLKAGATKRTLEIYRFEPVPRPVQSTPRRRPRLVRTPNERPLMPPEVEAIENSEEEVEDYDRDGPDND